MACTPVVAGSGTVYSCDTNGLLVALSPSGTPLWSVSPSGGDALGGSPALSHDGKILFVGSFSDSVYAINTATGATIWSATSSGYGSLASHRT